MSTARAVGRKRHGLSGRQMIRPGPALHHPSGAETTTFENASGGQYLHVHSYSDISTTFARANGDRETPVVCSSNECTRGPSR